MKKTISKKRNKLPLLLGALLLISLAAYGTRAYFSDSAIEQGNIALKLGNVQIISESSEWTYNKEVKGGQAKLKPIEGEKVSYTNVSSGDIFTRSFKFENTGSLATKMKVEQDLVTNYDGTLNDKEYTYSEGPYKISIIFDDANYVNYFTEEKDFEIPKGKFLGFNVIISLEDKIDNKYNDNGEAVQPDLDKVSLELLKEKITVTLKEK